MFAALVAAPPDKLLAKVTIRVDSGVTMVAPSGAVSVPLNSWPVVASTPPTTLMVPVPVRPVYFPDASVRTVLPEPLARETVAPLR